MRPGSCEARTALSGILLDSAQGLKKGIMKRTVSLILIYSLCAIAALSQQSSTPSPNAVVHVATALNHLTVLEFHEPVTMAAAGSSDFQIEREANKVFVKPIKSGAATDLFVWTASRRFAYELEITQEVKDMNFAIDTAQPAPAARLQSRSWRPTQISLPTSCLPVRSWGPRRSNKEVRAKRKVRLVCAWNRCFARGALSISITRSRTTAASSIA